MSIWRIVFIVTLVAAAASIKGTTTATMKCGGCPCNNPCYTTSPPPPSPPPPPPPSSSPPPPVLIPTTPTLGLDCPPPPAGVGSGRASPGFVYIAGPPGDLYPVNPYFSGSHPNYWAVPPVMAVFGVLCMLSQY
ncbi:hypothetical protein R6Q57_015180 [Mikania cordata]